MSRREWKIIATPGSSSPLVHIVLQEASAISAGSCHAFRVNFDHLLATSSLSGPSRSTKPGERKARSKARFNDLTTSGSSLLSFSKRLIGISQSPPAIGDYLKKYLMMDVGR